MINVHCQAEGALRQLCVLAGLVAAALYWRLSLSSCFFDSLPFACCLLLVIVLTMPRSKKPGWIDWLNCQTKQVIMEDMANADAPVVFNSARDAWTTRYSKMDVVIGEKVVYDQFASNYTSLKGRMCTKIKQSYKELQEFYCHWEMHPTKTHNHMGRPIFDVHEAKSKLKEDVDVPSKKHKSMTPATLHASRPEYQAFTLNEFRPRIYQEERRQKFEAYLNIDREAKEKARRELKEKARRLNTAPVNDSNMEIDS
jgi:hypothetical protein